MKYLYLAILLVSANAHGWTLNSSSLMKYSLGTIQIKIASDTCTNAGLTPSTIETLVQDSITEFWNTVPTSSLSLSTTGNSGIAFNNLATLLDAVNLTSKNTIIVGCSNAVSEFSSPGTLAVGGLGCAGSDCYGAVILNDKAGTLLSKVDRQTLLTTFAHELGHALGLGHTSVKEALMYYNLSNKTQKSLHQDDMDGISYLYPNSKKLGGIAGACGSVSIKDKDRNNFFTSFLLGLGVLLLLKIIVKSKAHTA
jgi:hypothetical protein